MPNRHYIRLQASGAKTLTPPPGHVLVIEHVTFTSYSASTTGYAKIDFADAAGANTAMTFLHNHSVGSRGYTSQFQLFPPGLPCFNANGLSRTPMSDVKPVWTFTPADTETATFTEMLLIYRFDRV